MRPPSYKIWLHRAEEAPSHWPLLRVFALCQEDREAIQLLQFHLLNPILSSYRGDRSRARGGSRRGARRPARPRSARSRRGPPRRGRGVAARPRARDPRNTSPRQRTWARPFQIWRKSFSKFRKFDLILPIFNLSKISKLPLERIYNFKIFRHFLKEICEHLSKFHEKQ